MALPLTIIGGYLGSGKTTMVNHLLRHADGRRLAVLVNEFGDLPIDEDLIEEQDDDIISISGGCVCCSYGNDLTLALMDMAALDPAPDHVLLESSGVALPGAIAASVSLLQGYALDGIVTLCNAETVMEQVRDTYIADTIQRQIEDADLIVLNKSDLVEAGRLGGIEEHLRKASGRAEVIAAQHGALPPEILLRSFDGQVPTEPASAAPHSHGFRTLSFPFDAPVDAEALARGLADPLLALVRAKGFVEDIGGARKVIQVVGRRWDVSPASNEAPTGIVVIGKAVDIDENPIRALIVSMSSSSLPSLHPLKK